MFHQFPFHFLCFFQNRSRRAFLAPKAPVYIKQLDLGTPFGFQWLLKSTLGAPFPRQNASKSPARPDADFASRGPPKPPQMHFFNFSKILDGFGNDFNGFRKDVHRCSKVSGVSWPESWAGCGTVWDGSPAPIERIDLRGFQNSVTG